jgi:hypothetical protein
MDALDSRAGPDRTLDSKYVNHATALPYGLTVSQVADGVHETYRLYDGINRYLVSAGFRPLEELLLGNSLSGLVSEFLVKNIARVSTTLIANKKVGGHPDLLPKDKYPSGSALKSPDGIEVKTSQRKGGWQGHNPEECWLMIFRYAVGAQSDGRTLPLTFSEVMCAQLLKSDWSFSGRKGSSRRTPTASITSLGVEKLRTNYLYRIPGVGVGRHLTILVGPAGTRDSG